MSDDKEQNPLPLPHFQKALRPYAADLPLETYRRYANGYLPKAVRLIAEHPELAEALAADARALAASAAEPIAA